MIPPSTKQDVRHLNETLRLCIPSYVTTFTGTVVQKVQKGSYFISNTFEGTFYSACCCVLYISRGTYGALCAHTHTLTISNHRYSSLF